MGVEILGLAGYQFFFLVEGGGTSFFWGDQHPVTCHVSVLLQFYISIQKVLGQLWRHFPFLNLCKCSCMLHPLPTVASTPLEKKPTTTGFIIYKYFTHSKIHHSNLGKSEKKVSTPRLTQENPEINPTPSFLNQHQK